MHGGQLLLRRFPVLVIHHTAGEQDVPSLPYPTRIEPELHQAGDLHHSP